MVLWMVVEETRKCCSNPNCQMGVMPVLIWPCPVRRGPPSCLKGKWEGGWGTADAVDGIVVIGFNYRPRGVFKRGILGE